MIDRSACIAALFSALVFLPTVRAQDIAATPVVQFTIDPPRVIVGQQTTLQLTVLAPNYLTAPPELPPFQVRNAMTRQLPSLNISEQRDGATYAGVRFSFALYPQEPGSYAIADQRIRVRYAAQPPATSEAEVALPRVSFEAFVPDGSAGLRPFVSAETLSAEQAINWSSEHPKPGDAVTRTVTIKAAGAPAMLLPPQAFAIIDGLRLYAAQPVLEDKAESRSGTLTSTRVDAATYMVERPGNHSLPAIDMGWWNVKNGTVERIHLAAVSFEVASSAADEATDAGSPSGNWSWWGWIDVVADHRLITALALILLVALAAAAPAVTRRMSALCRHRLAAYRASEAWSYRRFRAAARRRDAEATYFDLLDWLRRFEPLAAGTVHALTSAVDDPVLKREIDRLQRGLFASAEAPPWSPRTLTRRVGSARKTLRRRLSHAVRTTTLPRQINPIMDSRTPASAKGA